LRGEANLLSVRAERAATRPRCQRARDSVIGVSARMEAISAA
jgi:hypothetical protein